MQNFEADFPFLRTKLHRPQVPSDFVPRPQLIERLEHGREKPLTLVCGPAGYGKSTLMSRWLESSRAVGAWLSIDEHDSDLRVFLTGFTAAIQKAVEGACPRAREMVGALELPPLRVVATVLINELDGIEEALTLVLDDYHLVRDGGVHELLDSILARPPQGFHLVITSRHDPPLSLAALRAKNSLTEIRVDELSFTAEESLSFLDRAIEPALDRPVAIELAESIEGWAAGLRLSALSVRNRDDALRLVTGMRGGSQFAADYLVSEVIEDQSPEILDYLIATSVLDRFCGPLCDALGSLTEDVRHEVSGEDFVEWAARTNLFVTQMVDDHGRWLRYHQLFRSLLRHQLEKRVSRHEIARIHTRASIWCEENELYQEALGYTLEAGDVHAAGIVVARHRQALMNGEHWQVLHQMFARLPPDVVANDPALVIQAAWNAENRHRLEEMMERLVQAEDLLGRGSHERIPPGLTGEIAALNAARRFYAADADGARELAQQAMDTLPADALSARGFASGVLTLAHQMSGDYSAAADLVSRGLQDETLLGTTYHARLLISLAFSNWCEGSLPAVLRTAAQLQALGEGGKLEQTRHFSGYFNGIAHYYRNELGAAESALAPVVEKDYMVDRNTFVHSCFALALTYAAQRRPEEAEGVAELAVGTVMEPHNARLLRHAQAFHADLALRQGRAAEADSWARSFDPDPILPGLRFYVPQLTLAKVLVAQDTAESRHRARDLLTRLEAYFTETHNACLLMEVLSWRAMLDEVEGDRQAALAKLEDAVTAGARSGIIRPFIDLGPRFVEMLSRLELEGEVMLHAGRIQAAFNDETLGTVGAPADALGLGTPPFSSQPLFAPLSNREIEVLGLLSRRLSNKEIAARLYITPATVKRHTVNIYQKLNVHGRREAAAKASALGLISSA